MFHPPGVIAVPHRGDVGADLVHVAAGLKHKLMLCEGGDITLQRNQMARLFLHADEYRDCAWICMIDADQAPEENTIELLLATGRPLVSAVILKRGWPFNVTAFHDRELRRPVKYAEVPAAGTLDVAACGTGCLVIFREVLEALGPPYFRCGQLSPTTLQEDVDFTLRAGAAGFPPTLAGGARVLHRFCGQVYLGFDGQPWIQLPGAEDMRMPLPIREDSEIA